MYSRTRLAFNVPPLTTISLEAALTVVSLASTTYVVAFAVESSAVTIAFLPAATFTAP